jgi:hypothetical protein
MLLGSLPFVLPLLLFNGFLIQLVQFGSVELGEVGNKVPKIGLGLLLLNGIGDFSQAGLDLVADLE